MKAYFKKHILNFKQPSGTSRGILNQKETWFLIIEKEGKVGIGECGMFRGLSSDDVPDYENKLQHICDTIEKGLNVLYQNANEYPSIQFGLETAFKSLNAENPFLLFPSNFTEGNTSISINGLIWMGDKNFMKNQIVAKIEQGFQCLKLKIGALDFEAELDLLKMIRSEFFQENLEIRVDANGAFTPADALEKLERLSQFNIHSIEQPIKPKQWEEMARICEKTPIAVALDEELIGINAIEDKETLLEAINPQYIILKPTLVGGYKSSKEWINLAESKGIGWWITSALESNVGLNAIAQWTYQLNSEVPQGLGTGGLFTNNIACPLMVKNAKLRYEPSIDWDFKF